MTEIVVWNQATTPLGMDLTPLVNGLQKYANDWLFQAWGVSCTLELGVGPVDGKWGLVFLDNSDQADALAYHTLTPQGLPIAKVFVETILANGDLISVAASHELAEMLVDPDVNILRHFKHGMYFAEEVCDPVEEAPHLPIDGIAFSNFVYPAWFKHYKHTARYDALGVITAPFTLAPGGYQVVYSKKTGWSNIFGSADKAARFSLEDRRGHRSTWRV